MVKRQTVFSCFLLNQIHIIFEAVCDLLCDSLCFGLDFVFPMVLIEVGTFKSSNNTTTTGTSRGSNISSNSGFSVASGEDAYPEGQILPIPNLRIFSLAELRAATRNFKSENVLGEGGFGKVFKGWLEDKTPGKHSNGTVIAVKKLNAESFQGFEEWQVSRVSLLNESWDSGFL